MDVTLYPLRNFVPETDVQCFCLYYSEYNMNDHTTMMQAF